MVSKHGIAGLEVAHQHSRRDYSKGVKSGLLPVVAVFALERGEPPEHDRHQTIAD